MDLGLNNKTVLVAGSSRGIGRSIAEAFLREGARVMITGRDSKSLEKAASALSAGYGNNVITYRGDLTKSAEIEICLKSLKSSWGDPECVIANIGRGRMPNNTEFTENDWSSAFEINFHGGVRLAEAVLPAMRRKKNGSIIFTSSIAGIEDIGAPMPYSSSKAAIIAYSNALAARVAADGIRINTVAPGNILFPGGSWDEKLSDNKERIESLIRDKVPMRRFGAPEEIADTVVFLSSDKSSFTTGACFVVDGGQISRL